MPSNCNGVSCFQHIFEKNIEVRLKFGYFHFCVSSSTFLTASWLPIFVSAEPSWTILSIDRSEPKLKSHTEGKIQTHNNLVRKWTFNNLAKLA